jgi:hypothetical protein
MVAKSKALRGKQKRAARCPLPLGPGTLPFYGELVFLESEHMIQG